VLTLTCETSSMKQRGVLLHDGHVSALRAWMGVNTLRIQSDFGFFVEGRVYTILSH
jgi:hypothetical protein